MKPIHPIAQAEMLAEVAIARVLSGMLSMEQLLRLAGEAARFAERFPAQLQGSVPRVQAIAQAAVLSELLAHRASRVVPGARCMHRALAGRVWLARRGIASKIVVGFRKRGVLEGHAWLEIQAPDGPFELFKGTDDGYRESFREVRYAV